MKQVVLSLLGSLLGVGIALLAYDHFVLRPREASRLEVKAIDLTQAAADARKITEGVDASVRKSVDSAQQALDAQAAEQDKRRMAAEAIAQTQLYKVALTESFMANGKWPTRASEAGLPQDNPGAGGAIRNISVGDRGRITVTFDKSFAEGARFELLPEADPGTFQVRWQCRTSGDADLKRFLPQCEGS